ncbi:phage late control D family protein [Agarilytica rhodophyticola]|uniref:phage late control D family protein n=1 Tax=Agarilytica rhodophyticola TaxID=1737490 RepID=UPI000B340F6B|nr:contractile injection system protein, VgrG/Pvc8 family [Agarilytica rhodophyticola]
MSLYVLKTRSWDNVLLSDIVKTIAAEHDVIPRIAEVLSNIRINHEDQTEESDLHFLTRLAKKNGAIAKLANKNLIIVVEGDSKAISGKNLPIINLNRENVIQHRLTQAERGKYKTVIAHWHDTQAAQKIPVTAGEGNPAFTIRHDYADAEEARRAAEAKLNALNRGSATLSLTLIGDTRLQAEGVLQLDNFREPLNSDWLIKHVEHQLNNSGFTTRLDAEAPNT